MDLSAAGSNSDPFLSSLSFDGSTPRSTSSNCQWDVAACCQPLLPTFHYLSSKLAFQGLHIAFIVLGPHPELLPAWPMDRHTQKFLSKLVARADIKYSIHDAWIEALNRLCKPNELGEMFDAYRGRSYLIHRSVLQKDIIYSGDGLTVLAVDYIYKFKEQLLSLAEENTFPIFREERKESCVTLLRHINEIYKDIPLSKAYLRRAYTNFTYKEDIVEEVCEAYFARYNAPAASESPLSLQASSNIHAEDPSVVIVDQLQESPRKAPRSLRRVKHSKTFASRAADQPLKGHITGPSLQPPFEFDTTFDRPSSNIIARPKSPKGDLFESPKSILTSPSKSSASIVRSMTDPTSLHTNIPIPTSLEDPYVSDRAETTSIFSTISSKRKRLLASWRTLARSASVSLPKKLPMKIHASEKKKPVDNTTRDESLPAKPVGPRPLPLPVSHVSGISSMPLVSPTAKANDHGSVNASAETHAHTHALKHQPRIIVRSNASDSKFGWIHVMKKGPEWGMSVSQRVL